MNIPFDIVKGMGPIIHSPIRTAAGVDQVREFVPEEYAPYVGEALTILRSEVDPYLSLELDYMRIYLTNADILYNLSLMTALIVSISAPCGEIGSCKSSDEL